MGQRFNKKKKELLTFHKISFVLISTKKTKNLAQRPLLIK